MGVVGTVHSPANSVVIIGFCSTIVVSLLGLLQGAKTSSTTDRVEAKTDHAARAALSNAASLSDLGTVASATHTLVNSNMEIELAKNLELTRWKASREPSPENERAVAIAAEKLRRHREHQTKVDEIKRRDRP